MDNIHHHYRGMTMAFFKKKQASDTKELTALMVKAIRKGAVQLATRRAYFKRVILHLGQRELDHYRPVLSDLKQTLQDELNKWYLAEGMEAGPELVLLRGDEATHVDGSFQLDPIPNQLV